MQTSNEKCIPLQLAPGTYKVCLCVYLPERPSLKTRASRKSLRGGAAHKPTAKKRGTEAVATQHTSLAIVQQMKNAFNGSFQDPSLNIRETDL